MLEAATLKPIKFLYDSTELRADLLDFLLNEVKEIYNYTFYKFLKYILEFQEEKRPTIEIITLEINELKNLNWWKSEIPSHIEQISDC